MPRRPRGELRGEIHHVLNRGNNKQTVFHDDRDFEAFIRTIAESRSTQPVKLYAFTIMSNHFHALIRPPDLDTMSRFMHRVQRRATIRHHARYDFSGHLWQGRYKGFPVQDDSHFLTVTRYVLQNPVRAGIAGTPRDYPWNSLSHPELVDPWPVERPADFNGWLADSLNEDELRPLRHSTNRQFPFGSTSWTTKTATQLGIRLHARPGRLPKLPKLAKLKLGTGTDSKS